MLNGLRRQQLRDLAYGYGIEVKKDGTKEEILPAMQAAEQAGVFQGKPMRPEYVVKASRTSDDPSVDWQAYAAPDDFNYRHLQKLAKEHGINSFQKSEEDLKGELKAAGVL